MLIVFHGQWTTSPKNVVFFLSLNQGAIHLDSIGISKEPLEPFKKCHIFRHSLVQVAFLFITPYIANVMHAFKETALVLTP